MAAVAAGSRHRLVVHRIGGKCLCRRVAGLAGGLRRNVQDRHRQREAAVVAGAAEV